MKYNCPDSLAIQYPKFHAIQNVFTSTDQHICAKHQGLPFRDNIICTLVKSWDHTCFQKTYFSSSIRFPIFTQSYYEKMSRNFKDMFGQSANCIQKSPNWRYYGDAHIKMHSESRLTSEELQFPCGYLVMAVSTALFSLHHSAFQASCHIHVYVLL